ncbi:hypothetical protein L1887_30131 [Cichorium endivia]|nr:hypothetical protein L1887_30131 [Cichorium endivia]
MDFQTLNRRELQALCKLNKIPANMTNIAMIDALKSLETVEGIEEFLNPSRSETSRMSTESPERSEVTSPRVPRTSCRTSTRQKAKKTETEPLHATVNRATSRGVRRQLAGDVNEVLKTPMVSSTRKKAVATFSSQDDTSQLNENEGTVKKETTTVQRAYSTRRSTRLTAKKSEEPGVMERERSEPVKIDSFLDEVNDLVTPIEEKHDVVVLEESDENSKIETVVHVDTTVLESEAEKVDCCGEVENTNVKSVEMFGQLENVDLEIKPDSKPCEDGDSETKSMVIDEKIDLNETSAVSVKEHTDSFLIEADEIDANALSSAVSGAKNEISEYNGDSYISENLTHFNTESESPIEPSILDKYHIDKVVAAAGISENIPENKVDFGEVQETLMEETGDEVSDNKENEENINEKEGGNNKSLNDTSLRQLKKQLKALTIKNNTDASCVTITEMEN